MRKPYSCFDRKLSKKLDICAKYAPFKYFSDYCVRESHLSFLNKMGTKMN